MLLFWRCTLLVQNIFKEKLLRNVLRKFWYWWYARDTKVREAFSLPSGSTQSRGVRVRGAGSATRVSLCCLPVNKVKLWIFTISLYLLFCLVNPYIVITFVFVFNFSVLNKKRLSTPSVYPVVMYVPYPNREPKCKGSSISGATTRW